MAWNIRHGGGRRVPQILEVIHGHSPDLLVLTEFRHNRVAADLSAGIHAQGLKFQAAPNAPPSELSVMVASRSRFTGATLEQQLPLWPFRGLRADFPSFAVLAFYLPTGERKRPILHFLRDAAKTLLRNQTLLIGDFNTGLPYQDERGSELTCSAEFSELLARGWIDLWRIRHPNSRERSYYERPWLGYRIDHALGSPAFNQRVREIYYSHAEREAGISDHSSLHLLIGRQR